MSNVAKAKLNLATVEFFCAGVTLSGKQGITTEKNSIFNSAKVSQEASLQLAEKGASVERDQTVGAPEAQTTKTQLGLDAPVTTDSKGNVINENTGEKSVEASFIIKC